MRAEIGNPPAVPFGGNFQNDDPRGCLASIAHAVIYWTIATKEDMMSKDDETFRKVLGKTNSSKGRP